MRCATGVSFECASNGLISKLSLLAGIGSVGRRVDAREMIRLLRATCGMVGRFWGCVQKRAAIAVEGRNGGSFLKQGL